MRPNCSFTKCKLAASHHGLFHPRIGQEVLVDFIEGDIDRPVITGMLYNGSHPPPAFSGAGSLPANRMLDRIRQNMQQQFDLFKKEVDGWIAKSRNNAAAPHKPSLPATPHKPKAEISGTQGKASSHAKPDQPVRGNSPGSKASKIDASDMLKTLGNKATGILGEHMADYLCQQRWGGNARHDAGKVNTGKLNDAGELVQLWSSSNSKAGLAALRARGRGIDAVWQTGGKTGKPYAVVEAKASANPTRRLKDLLGDAADKEGADGVGDSSTRRGRRQQARAGSTASTGGLSLPEKSQRQTDGRVTQMSKAWVNRRLEKAVGHVFEEIKDKKGYTRHVLFFSIPHAAGHAMALSRWVAGQGPTADSHKAHEATREWRDGEIDKVVDNRAGLADKQRDHRNFSKIG